MSLMVTLLAAPIALFLAVLAGLARRSDRYPVRIIAIVYVELFRGTSLIVQLFYFYYVMPLFGISIDPVVTGVLVLGLNSGAYGSEVVRAALGAVAPGQHEACLVLGMSPRLAMRRVIFPQAFVAMIPPFGNLLVEMLKATSLLSLITIFDLSFAGNTLFQTTGRTIEIYGLVLVIYFLMASALTFAVRRVEIWFGAGRESEFRA